MDTALLNIPFLMILRMCYIVFLLADMGVGGDDSESSNSHSTEDGFYFGNPLQPWPKYPIYTTDWQSTVGGNGAEMSPDYSDYNGAASSISVVLDPQTIPTKRTPYFFTDTPEINEPLYPGGGFPVRPGGYFPVRPDFTFPDVPEDNMPGMGSTSAGSNDIVTIPPSSGSWSSSVGDSDVDSDLENESDAEIDIDSGHGTDGNTDQTATGIPPSRRSSFPVLSSAKFCFEFQTKPSPNGNVQLPQVSCRCRAPPPDLPNIPEALFRSVNPGLVRRRRSGRGDCGVLCVCWIIAILCIIMATAYKVYKKRTKR